MWCKCGHEVVTFPPESRGTKPACSTVWFNTLDLSMRAEHSAIKESVRGQQMPSPRPWKMMATYGVTSGPPYVDHSQSALPWSGHPEGCPPALRRKRSRVLFVFVVTLKPRVE